MPQMEEPEFRNKWKNVRGTLLWCLVAGAFLNGGISFWLWGSESVFTAEAAFLCLALGFWLTEMLLGVFSGVKRANATAIALLFIAKVAWWVALFWAANRIPPGHNRAVALGVGTFLVALLVSTFKHFGMPTISDEETNREP